MEFIGKTSQMGSSGLFQVLIEEVKAEDTWELRRNVMWPDKDISYVKLEEDALGVHYGLFLDGVLTSVVSLFVKDGVAQFRKFATLNEKQGQGYGSTLLQHIIAVASELKANTLWCNARKDKADFYKKFRLQETKHTFSKSGKAYVVMERQLV